MLVIREGSGGARTTNRVLIGSGSPSRLSGWGPGLEVKPRLTLSEFPLQSEERPATLCTLLQHYGERKGCLRTACDFRVRYQINQMFAQTVNISEIRHHQNKHFSGFYQNKIEGMVFPILHPSTEYKAWNQSM